MLTALAEEFGSQAVVCAIDVRGGRVVTHGGRMQRDAAAVEWAARPSSTEPVSCSSPRSTPTGRELDTTSSSPARSRGPSRFRDRVGRGGRRRVPSRRRIRGRRRGGARRFDRARAARAGGRAESRAEGGGLDAPPLTPAIVQDADSGRVPDAGLDGRRGATADARDRGGLVLEPVAAGALAQGRNLGSHAPGGGAARRLRRRRILLRVRPGGPACHTGTESCFAPWLWRRVKEREHERPDGSYVVSLLDDPALAARKVGEEGLEAALAGAAESDDRLVEELADLWFHTLRVAGGAGARPRPRRSRARAPRLHSPRRPAGAARGRSRARSRSRPSRRPS